MRPRSARTEDASIEPDPYALLPELYDLEHSGFDDDVSLYLSLAEAVGDPILELGCGTGRLLVPLARADWRVTGVDRSRPMLDRAAAELRRANSSAKVTLAQAEMDQADQAPGGPFGLVVVALNGLMHLADPSRQRAALEAIHRALDPRGQVVIDLVNPDSPTVTNADQTVVHEGRWALADGSQVDKFSSRRVHRSDQLIETELWYDRISPDGTVKRTPSSFPLRYVHRAELELMLELAGFAEWQVYGGYDLEPFDDGSDRLIVTAEITPSA